MSAQRRPARVLAAAAAAVLDFVFPPLCLICGEHVPSDLRLVCASCWRALPRFAGSSESEFSPDDCPLAVHSVFSMWAYDERVAKVIHEAKFYGKRVLCRRIGAELGRTVCDFLRPETADVLVPVPLHKTRLRERGFNQSKLLAETISRLTGVMVLGDAIRRVRHTRAQSTLGAAERARNLEGAFEIASREAIDGKRVVLVDDVLTTGATLAGCAAVLGAAGAAEVMAVTAARAGH